MILDRDYFKRTAVASIAESIDEFEEVLTALRELKTAIETENLRAIKDSKETLAGYTSTAYGEHLRFELPQTYDFISELEFEAESKKDDNSLEAMRRTADADTYRTIFEGGDSSGFSTI
jgi:hypothetical protein